MFSFKILGVYIFFFFILSSSFRLNKMWQIGHRGFPDKHGDNNMASFYAAHRVGFDMIELDIQLCNTGEIVVYHDTWFKNKYILDTPYDELKKDKMVLLEEVFEAFVATKMMLFLDIKGTEKVVEPLIKLMDKWFSRADMNRIYISGFNRKFVKDIKKPSSRFNLGLTTENMFPIKQIDLLCEDMDFICLHWTALDKEIIDHLHKKGILVFSYTCKDDFILNHMLEHDIDGVVTNYFITEANSHNSSKKFSSQCLGTLLDDTEFQANIEFSA